MTRRKGLLPVLFFLLVSCGEKNVLTYTNPLLDKYLADPCMVYDEGYYYLFATGRAEDGRFIPIHRTMDLVSWEFIRGAVERGSETDWNYKHFWAPEVILLNGKWHLYNMQLLMTKPLRM